MPSTIRKILTRALENPFSREILIDRNDFMEDPPKKYFRMAPGREVRLKYAYYVTCTEVIRDESGEISELICSYDPESRGGGTPDGRKVKGTIQWVDARTALPARPISTTVCSRAPIPKRTRTERISPISSIQVPWKWLRRPEWSQA